MKVDSLIKSFTEQERIRLPVSLVTTDAPLSISKSSGDGKAKAPLKAARPWRNAPHPLEHNARNGQHWQTGSSVENVAAD